MKATYFTPFCELVPLRPVAPVCTSDHVDGGAINNISEYNREGNWGEWN